MYARTYYINIQASPTDPEQTTIFFILLTNYDILRRKITIFAQTKTKFLRMTPTTTLDYRLIFALMNGKVSTALRRRLNADFRAADLEVTGEQWDVLMAISSRDLCTQQDLCEATSFSKPTMTRTINVLEEMHLVTRRKARVDFRRNYISLTIKGLNMVDHAQAIAVRTLKECLRGLSKMEMLTAQNSLNIVLENLRRQEQQRAQKQSEEQHRTAEANRRAVRRMHAAASGKR